MPHAKPGVRVPVKANDTGRTLHSGEPVNWHGIVGIAVKGSQVDVGDADVAVVPVIEEDASFVIATGGNLVIEAPTGARVGGRVLVNASGDVTIVGHEVLSPDSLGLITALDESVLPARALVNQNL